MSAAQFWVEIVCDECAKSHAGRFVRTRIPIRDMMQDADRDGWKLVSTGVWRCSQCFENGMRELAKELRTLKRRTS